MSAAEDRSSPTAPTGGGEACRRTLRRRTLMPERLQMPNNLNSDGGEISGLLEQLTRRMHSQGYSARLFPAQWSALRYIQSAPPHLRTAIDLARYQGLASGAVARTVRTLIRKGYLEKHGTIGRGRAEALELTDRGRQLMKRDPLQTISKAIEGLEETQKSEMASGLRVLVRSMGGRIDGTEAPDTDPETDEDIDETQD